MASDTLPFAETLSVITSLIPKHLQKPRVGIICGSGLGGLAESLKEVVEVPYEKLPGFARSTGELLDHLQMPYILILDIHIYSYRAQGLPCLWTDRRSFRRCDGWTGMNPSRPIELSVPTGCGRIVSCI